MRCAITLFLSLLFPGSLLQAADTGSTQAPPNIVVFLVDDMGLMDSSLPFLSNGKGKPASHPLNKYYRTPSMERLAAQGLRFSEFYANSVCSPTRVTLMTGQSSARHRTTQYIKPESKNTGANGPAEWIWKGPNKKSITLPGLLRKAGYRTIHCGKAHFGPEDSEAENPSNIGFDVNIAGCAYGQPGSYYGMKNFGNGIPKRSKRAVPGLEQYHGKDIFLTEALTIEINKAISKSVKEKKPFFAYMSHYAVHSPFESDPRFAKNYAGSKKAKSAQAYASLIEGMDKSLGDMMDHLEKLGVAENTLILFLGDNGSDAPLGATHGYSSSAPLRGKKGTHYEGGMRVPFIVAWAKPSADSAAQKEFPVSKGFLDSEFATICDIFPSVLSLAGAKAPGTYKTDGKSLWPTFGGARNEHPQQFLMHFPHSHRSSYFTAYREADWKLIYHYISKDGKQHELFNLAKDPYEKEECSASNPEVLKRMIKAMQDSLEEADALYPISKTGGKPLKVK